jgi:hypothetical protein
MRSKSAKAMLISAVWGPIFIFAAQRAVAAPPGDACSLLTQDQVSAALGVSVAAGQGIVPKLCQWSQPAKPGADVMKLDLTIITMDGFTGAKTERGPVTTTPVSGLGDEAYYFAMASGDRMTLRVKKGSVALSIRVYGGGLSVDQIKAKERALAPAILAKL